VRNLKIECLKCRRVWTVKHRPVDMIDCPNCVDSKIRCTPTDHSRREKADLIGWIGTLDGGAVAFMCAEGRRGREDGVFILEKAGKAAG
jgi:hypothetical protein